MIRRNNVVIIIYRSLLKWARNPILRVVPFTLNPSELGIDHLVIQKSFHTPVVIISAIKTCFRMSNISTHCVDISLAFSVYKKLNEFEKNLRSHYNQHNHNLNPVVNKIAKYKLGDIIEIESLNVRGAVVGWDVDEKTLTQNVKVLIDELDGHNSTSLNRQLAPIFEADSNLLKYVEDDDLLRIFNSTFPSYFKSFDPLLRRYLPNKSLMYSYPLDFNQTATTWYQSEVVASSKVIADDVAKICQRLQCIMDRHNFKSITNQNKEEKIKSTYHIILSEVLSEIPNIIRKCLRYQSHGGENSLISNDNRWMVGFKSLKDLIRCYASIDQLLQLRYQSFGIHYFENLVITPNKSVVDKSAFHLSPKDCDFLSTLSPQFTSEASIHQVVGFKVGQIVRHKKFGYLGVVMGWDYRPLLDVSQWEGVIGLSRGREQPFYRVIPDESDVEDMIGQGQHRDSYYVAEDNLDLVFVDSYTENGMRVQHRDMNLFFHGYNADRNIYNPTNVLKFAFPNFRSKGQFIDMKVNGNNHLSTEYDIFNANIDLDYDESDETRESFRAIEIALLEMYAVFKTAFTHSSYLHSATSTSLSGVQGDDANVPCLHHQNLLKLLRLAPSPNHALIVEGALYWTQRAHPNPTVSTRMRLGHSSLKRGNTEEAKRFFQEAANFVTNSNYAEAYHGLATASYMEGEMEQARMWALHAIEANPHHISSLPLLALINSESGHRQEAIIACRNTLQVNPWSSQTSSLLHRLLLEEKKSSKSDRIQVGDDDMMME